MSEFVADFGPFGENVWINASSIGPMPRTALEAAEKAIGLNVAPYRIPETIFAEVPQKLKVLLGKLIGTRSDDVILGNSASYGVHLWANGIPLKKGDEVLLAKGDFPASILPWLYLRKHGIKVHEISPKGPVLHIDDVQNAISSRTKILAPTWVDSFTGYRLDAKALGQLCQDQDILFLLNLTQGLGGEPFDVSKVPVDGITSTGYKWLCGPYATGFCWMKPELIDSLEYNQAYWIPHQGERELDKIREYQILTNLGAAQYDVFGTANLFNFLPWIECIQYFVEKGLSKIKRHNLALVDQFLRGLDSMKYTVHSPQIKNERTAIILISHIEPERNQAIYKLLQEEQIFISFREGLLRFSPHLYNTPTDIDKTLTILNSFC